MAVANIAAHRILVGFFRFTVKFLAHSRIVHGSLQSLHHQRMRRFALTGSGDGDLLFKSVGQFERCGGGQGLAPLGSTMVTLEPTARFKNYRFAGVSLT